MKTVVKTFKALSDTNRLRILKILQIRPLCVCEIANILQLANSTTSKHLAILRDAGFILDNKHGKWVSYDLTDASGNDYVDELMPLVRRWLPDDSIIQKDAEKAANVDRLKICGT